MEKQNKELREFYDKMETKDKNLYYIEGKKLTGTDLEGTMDGIHLNDLGFWRMTQVVAPIIKGLVD